MSLEYFSIYPSKFKLDGGAMFGIIPKPLWSKKINSDANNQIEMSLRIFCVKTEHKTILLDTGIGAYHNDQFNQRFGIAHASPNLSSQLSEALNSNNNDITDIVLTHLHFDHAGGLLSPDGKSVSYPKARLHLHKKHYQYSLHPTERDKGSFQAEYLERAIDYYRDQNLIQWHDHFEGVLLEDDTYQLRFKTSHGHTPYQVLPYDSKMIYMGDLLPTAHHLNLPWVMGYDMRPGLSTEEKASIYQFIYERQLILVFDHDLDYWGGRIKIGAKGKWEFSELYERQEDHWEKHSIA
jgi:glyoxylase-like metal-dependent hydrolase (beta-lactamase superfamily II)